MDRFEETESHVPRSGCHRWRAGADAWAWAHVCSLWTCTSLALALGLGRGSGALVAGVAAAAFVLLAAAHALRPALIDFFGQFQYRGKFALFLLHLLAAVSPRLLLHDNSAASALAAVALLLCIQAQRGVDFGRLLMIDGLIALVANCSAPTPPAWMTAAWLASLLAAMLLERVRLRLEAYGSPGATAPVLPVLGEVVLSCMAPVAFGGGVYWFIAPRLGPRARHLAFEGFNLDAFRFDGPATVPELLRDVVLLVATIAAGFALLVYLDRRLRTRGRSVPAGEELLSASAEHRAAGGARSEPPPAEVRETGPRARVLDAFARFIASMRELGRSRAAGETADEFLARCDSAAAGRTFDAACYSSDAIPESAASDFESRLAASLAAARPSDRRA